MKAFERLEKAEQRKQEVQARNAQRKESGGLHSDNEDSSGHAPSKSKQSGADKAPRRKRRKGRTRSSSISHSQGTRRTRLNSAESDLTSGDESNSMQSPPLSNQNCSYSLRVHAAKDVGEGGDAVTPSETQPGIPTAAGLLLALANSSTAGSSSPPQQQPTPIKSPTCDSGASSSSQSSTPSTPLSSACLLVAAAVGPLAPGFKFPKTKKLLMNEWLKESPEPQSQTCETRGSEFGPEQSSEFLSQNYAAKSLATLVQAAHSVSGICEATPQRGRQGAPVGAPSASGGSAKKRWLRQAISEECDSPNSSRPESPPSEMVAPPKKRRIARESLSSDNYTPPSTPTMMQQDHVSAHRRSINEVRPFIAVAIFCPPPPPPPPPHATGAFLCSRTIRYFLSANPRPAPFFYSTIGTVTAAVH
jgi:histone-lysine N-methyltransferase MLL5